MTEHIQTNKQMSVSDICEGERTWQRDLYFINPPTSHGRPKEKFILATDSSSFDSSVCYSYVMSFRSKMEEKVWPKEENHTYINTPSVTYSSST